MYILFETRVETLEPKNISSGKSQQNRNIQKDHCSRLGQIGIFFFHKKKCIHGQLIKKEHTSCYKCIAYFALKLNSF